MTGYSDSHWRNSAQPIITRVLAENAGKPEREIRTALRNAYPFGPRKYHPYKIWLDEIGRQRGIRPKLGTRLHVKGRPTPTNPDERQADLFEVSA